MKGEQLQLVFGKVAFGSPMHTVRDTRERAMTKVKPKIRDIQIMLLRDFYNGERVSADDWANKRGINPYLVRPRLSYFKKGELICRIGFAFTNDGNSQERFQLFPYVKTRMDTLVKSFGIDKAIEQILVEFGPENFRKKQGECFRGVGS